MLETPTEHDARPGRDGGGAPQVYGAVERREDSLRRYSWHTGGALRPLGPEEVCPVLFRDLGPAATGRFLRGELGRLAGPYSPIIYTRTAGWVEPYVDHGAIGRLMFLRPLTLGVWHAGVEHVYVARAQRTVEAETVVYVPGHVGLGEAAAQGAELAGRGAWREALGGRGFDAMVEDAQERIEALEAELVEAERLGEPLRYCLQLPEAGVREAARALMERVGLTEHDLCAAWHHLEAGRRRWILEALGEVEEGVGALTARVPEGLRRRYQVGVR